MPKLGGLKTYEAFEWNFEGASARYLLEVRQVGVVVGDQITVKVVGQVWLWDLISNAYCIWNAFDYGARY